MCLVEVLDDGVGIRKDLTVFFDEDGQVARGIERQKIFASFPQFFDMHVKLEVLLGQNNADRAAKRRKPKVIDCAHVGDIRRCHRRRNEGIAVRDAVC